MAHLGIFLLIFGAAFAMSPWVVSQYALPKLWVLSIGNLLIWASIIMQKDREAHWTPMLFPSFYLLGVMALCTLSSVDWGMSVFGHYCSYTDGLLTVGALIGVAHGIAYAKHVSNRFVIGCVVAMAIIASAYACAQSMGYELPRMHGLIWKTEGGRIMPSAGFGHPVYFGTAIAILFPVMLWLAMKTSIVGMIGCASLLFAAALTTKRGVWVGVLSGAVTYLLLAGYVRLTIRKALLALAVLSVGLICYIPRLYGTGTDAARMEAWKVAISVFRERPMVGSGPDTFAIPYRQKKTFASVSANKSSRYVHFHAHNDFLQVASTLGFFGITAYALVLMGLIFTLMNIKEAGASRAHLALMSGIVGVFVVAKVNPIPIGTLMLCAVAVGFMMRVRSPIRHDISSRRYHWAMLAASIPAVFFVSRAMVGDYYRLQAHEARRVDPLTAAQQINKAAQWAPWVFDIRKEQAQSLYFLPMRASKEMGMKIAEMAVRIGESCVKYHPRNSEAQSLYASTLIVRQRWGGPKVPVEIMDRLDKAQAMAPLFIPLMRQRAFVANAIGDRKKFLSIQKNIDVVQGFASRGI